MASNSNMKGATMIGCGSERRTVSAAEASVGRKKALSNTAKPAMGLILILTVNHELDVLRQIVCHLGDDVSFQQSYQRMAVRRTEHQDIDPKRCRHIHDGRSGIVAHDEERNDRH